MRVFFFLFAFTSLLNVKSQVDFGSYKPIECEGEIPDDFVQAFKLGAIENIKKFENDNRVVFKAKQKFVLKSYEVIGETLKSGSVLFGDPITTYLEDLLTVLLKEKPELRKKLRIYTLKSAAPNAFCTPQGIIFITVGFLSRVRTEADLCHVLLHEVSHYTEEHGLEGVVERLKMKKKLGRLKITPYSKILAEVIHQSQSKEFQCDSLATEILLNSEIDIHASGEIHDVMLESRISLFNDKFDINLFNDDELQIPEFFFKENTDAIDLDDNRYDKYSTHPNTRKRKAAFNRITKGKSSNGNKKFILSKERLNTVREMAKFETISCQLFEKEYAKAIYNASVLKVKYPQNQFLKEVLAYALYGLSKYASMNDLHKVAWSTRSIQGESQQVHHLFRQLSKQQINALAIHYIYKTQKQYTNNRVLSEMLKSLILDMPQIGTELEKIQKSSELIIESDITAYKTLSDRREKIKAVRELQRKYKNFYLYSLKNDFKEQALLEYYDAAIEDFEYNQKLNDMDYKHYEKHKKKRYKNAIENGFNFKNDTIYFLDPQLSFKSSKFKSIEKYTENLNEIKEFKKLLVNYLRNELNLKYKFLTFKDFNASNVSDFNKLMNLKLWESEKSSHSANDIIPLTTSNVSLKNPNIKYICGLFYSNMIETGGGMNVTEVYVANVQSGFTKFHSYQYMTGSPSPEKLLKRLEYFLKALSK